MSFHLVKAIFINRAPFEHLALDFKEKGINVLSAINGKGKTTVLSHIVDAFYEMSKPYYTYSFEGKENKYYRFSASEFTKHSMVHNECPNLTLSKPDGKGIDKILENNGGQAVYDENDNNILAKKDDFANAVISGNIKIGDESWENFRPILEKIKKLSEI